LGAMRFYLNMRERPDVTDPAYPGIRHWPHNFSHAGFRPGRSSKHPGFSGRDDWANLVTIDRTAQIARTAIIGSPFRPLLDGRQMRVAEQTVIEAGAWIGQYATIGQGVTIGASSMVEDHVAIQPLAAIGPRVLVRSHSSIGIGVKVGNDSVIKGHLGDHARVGAGCRIAGDLIHRQLDPSISWDDPAGEEPAPIVEDGAFVGWRAMVVGGINIGAGAYVCAGALITKEVPEGYIACGRNQIMPPSAWPGALGKSAFFQDAQGGRGWLPVQRDDRIRGQLGEAGEHDAGLLHRVGRGRVPRVRDRDHMQPSGGG
jgi:UDP-3-O-[3-hydroxymyristoyl] glucosamine N-acyltransferase